MPTSPGTSTVHARTTRIAVPDRAARVRFRRAGALLLMTLLLPGSAQIVAGNRRVGRAALRLWLALWTVLLVAGVSALFWHTLVFWALSNLLLLTAVRVFLMALALGWALLFIDAWRLGQPMTLLQNQRLAMAGFNGFLCFSVAGALLFGAHVVGVQRDFMSSMFGDEAVVGAHEGCYNILLLGGDAGAGRWGLRPDSINIASVDARTGKSVLIGLPRNMANFPFAKGSVMHQQFPNGFNCEGCYLNGVSTWAGDHTELFGKSRYPGVDATIMAVEGITGLRINYWAMVNLEGFKDLVDAFGGVTLNVRDRIPVGGLGDDVTGYIEPGVRKLNGHDTLWFARAREGSDDYSRMARQKCVMSAMLEQVTPQEAVRNFERIARASSAMVNTNVPRAEVGRFLSLAMQAKSQQIGSLSLVPPLINTADPDIALIKSRVQAVLDKATGQIPLTPTELTSHEQTSRPSKAPKPSTGTKVTGGSVGSLQDGYAANDAADLGAVC